MTLEQVIKDKLCCVTSRPCLNVKKMFFFNKITGFIYDNKLHNVEIMEHIYAISSQLKNRSPCYCTR